MTTINIFLNYSFHPDQCIYYSRIFYYHITMMMTPSNIVWLVVKNSHTKFIYMK